MIMSEKELLVDIRSKESQLDEEKLLNDFLTGFPSSLVLYFVNNYNWLSFGKDRFRKYFLNSPLSVFVYAEEIDEGPHGDTRKVACKDPDAARWYAIDVDGHARADTREAACKCHNSAFFYAKDVDFGFHKKTYEAVLGTENEDLYNLYILKEEDK